MRELGIECLNAAGDRWAAWMLAASLDAAVLLALVGLVWLVIRKRVAPQVGYGLFLLVPLKLLVPVVVSVPAAVAGWMPSARVAAWLDEETPAVVDEARPPIEVPIAAVETDRPTPPAPAMKPRPETAAVASAPSVREAGAPNTPEARSPALSLSGTLLIGWLAIVGLLLGRLIVVQVRFRRRLREMPALAESAAGIDLVELCRTAGINRTVRFVNDDSIAVPSAWGIVRPTILVPRGIAGNLRPDQLRWVLLHELAHVRRRDLAVLAFQRVAAILHFFNPVVWIANRIIDQLREYACDDMASALGRASAVESGEAFVSVLRLAGSERRRLAGALGVFGLDARASCVLRVRRLLDDERPMRVATGGWPLLGLVLLAAIVVPRLRAASESAPVAEPPQSAVAPQQEPAGKPASGQPFELRVVGPDGKPVAGAVVELGGDPIITPDRVRKGKLVAQRAFGTTYATDDEGRLIVELPSSPKRFVLFITMPGYGPYCAWWVSQDHDGSIPQRLTAELEAAWSVGGIVVDPDGKPIAGVEVRPSIEFRKPPGDTRQFGIGARARTDAAGKWRFDSVPVSMADVHVEIDHPSFQPLRQRLARADFGVAPGREPSTRIVLERGLTITGKVTDDAGEPIAGALVRTKFWNDVRQARTGPDGTYQLAGCEPKPARVVASAPGKAIDMKELNIEPGMGPVDFRLKPGGTVRIRVVDQQGNPVPRTRIFFQGWRGRTEYFEFDHVNQYANDQGVWEWHEAPLDEFQADICPPNGMQMPRQPLVAREQEYVFRVPDPLVVSGKVVDADSGKPIKEFRVVPGRRQGAGDNLFWNREDGFAGVNGRYELRESRGESAHLIRIEAEGYRAAVSRDIKSNEGSITIDFAMVKGKDVVAKVVTPRNAAAVGAKVALGIAGSQIHVKNGEVSDIQTYASRAVTAADGRFHFPAQDGNFELVITHPEGFALIRSGSDWSARIIRLEPWARVEGTYRVGKNPRAGAPIEIDVSRLESYGEGVPRMFSQHQATTGPDGRFVFARVIPGKGRIGRQITFMVNEGATEVTSSCKVAAEFPAGKTVHIDLGGTGRPVVGKLEPREGFTGKPRWNFASIRAMPAGAADDSNRPYYTVTADRDGRFRIDDVPPGRYSLDGMFHQMEDVGALSGYGFEVPAGRADSPVDLGVIRLKGR